MEPQMKISSAPLISPFHQFLKSSTMGTVTAIALAILSAAAAVRYGDFLSFSAVLIGGMAGFLVKQIHDACFILPEPGMGPDFILPELGMAQDALREKLSHDLYSLYDRIGIQGSDATEIVGEKLGLIFNKISQTIGELDKDCEKRSSNRLILPNGNFNELTICLDLQSHKEVIKIGRNSNCNNLTIDVESLDLFVEGSAAKAKLRDSESID